MKNNELDEHERICLEEHERLAKLFRKDRLSFERERKRLIGENIAARPEESKSYLVLMQQNVDRILQSAGSQENRFVMMQTLFWDHYINVWLPALSEFKRELGESELSAQKIRKVRLTLVNKRNILS